MPGPVIVIEAPEARQSPDLERSLVDACEVGLKETRCMLASEANSPGAPTAVATVAWRGTGRLDAVIEVGLRTAARPQWLMRELHFQAVDDSAERWKAVGFTIATLAREVAPKEIQERPEEPETDRTEPGDAAAPLNRPISAPTPPAKDRADPAPPRHAKASRAPFSVLAGFASGPGFEVGDWRFGGWLGGAYRFRPLPLGVRASGGYAVRPEDAELVSATWVTFSAGPTLHVPLPLAIGATASVELLAESVAVEAATVEGGADEGGRFVVGGKATLGLAWPEAGSFAGVLIGEGSRLSGGTTIQLRGERLASSPAANYSIRLGVEWRPF